ncbi:DCC1-like thiol-disulfide oxidoreductase family protein [Natronococcus sp.]|uniref:DCC1-like thiol-disulfide oxidoreductase family protein n=1 Tax=Natronococcus sp. TaxID=35747 RepID=UPI003A4E46AF
MTEPTLVFDDDCGFCTWWAEFFDDRTDVRVVGFTGLTPELRERLPEDYEECSHLVTDDAVYSCGASLEEGLARVDDAGVVRETVGFLRNFEDYERLREGGYRRVADNRDFWGQYLSKTPPVRREE